MESPPNEAPRRPVVGGLKAIILISEASQELNFNNRPGGMLPLHPHSLFLVFFVVFERTAVVLHAWVVVPYYVMAKLPFLNRSD